MEIKQLPTSCLQRTEFRHPQSNIEQDRCLNQRHKRTFKASSNSFVGSSVMSLIHNLSLHFKTVIVTLIIPTKQRTLLSSLSPNLQQPWVQLGHCHRFLFPSSLVRFRSPLSRTRSQDLTAPTKLVKGNSGVQIKE